jgi:hypothetical protein
MWCLEQNPKPSSDILTPARGCEVRWRGGHTDGFFTSAHGPFQAPAVNTLQTGFVVEVCLSALSRQRRKERRWSRFHLLISERLLLLLLLLWLCSPLLSLGRFFRFLILYTVGRTPWKGHQLVARPLPIHRTQTQNKRIQTSMPWVGFELTTPVFDRAKTVHALDRAATVFGSERLQK